MRSWKTPTPEQVAKAVALLGRREQYRYFFERLQNPFWLEPLAQRGFFQNPPPPIGDETAESFRFPPWPESQYLARMARLPEAYEQVLDIALRVETDNVSVHEDLADVALALPPHMAARLVPKAKQWAESAYQLVLPDKLGALVEHLARGGALDEALDLAAALLAVLPDRRPLPEDMGLPPDPVARFDVWQYEQILKKHLVPLVDAGGNRVLNLFCDLLESALSISRRQAQHDLPKRDVLEDYSWIWRPGVEEHEQNGPATVKWLLVSAVRDCAERLADRAPESVPELVRQLESRRWLIFRRVALHLLRRYPDAATGLVEERFTNRALFDDSRFRHEYVLLVADVFSSVSEAARQTFLDWINQGPDLEAFRTRHREATGREATEEEAVLYANVWRRDRLAPLTDVLPAAWERRYEELVAEVGEPEQPEFPVYTEAGWVGPTSPKSADELRTMAVASIVDFVKGWTPPAVWFGPSREGLGRELTSVVQADPQRFAEEARSFIGVHPTYVGGTVQGLTDAARAGRAFDWAPVLGLCEWVVQQPRELQEGAPSLALEEDSDWGWTRQALARLLSAGFAAGPAELPFDLRERAWGVLRVLTDDGEPTPEDEAEHGGSNMDPATLSINTTRGEAMHAVVRYALWFRRHLEQLPDGPVRVTSGLAEMPEVRDVLEAHLDPARDPSLAIRAVYGQWFPWLVFLDRPWASAQIARIFPEEDPVRRDVAWETYVVFCMPYDDVFEVLEGEYAKAVERLGTGAPGVRRHLADPEERLAEHLMLLYGRGKLALGPPTGLLGRFFEKAPTRVRGRAIEFIGRSVRDTKGEIPESLTQRFTALWEYRLQCARSAPAESLEELANFGWWFVSQRFEESWSLRQLEEVLALAKRVAPRLTMMISQTLASIAARRPREAVRCLDGLVQADREGWGILASEEEVRAILGTAMGSHDTEARRLATSLIHKLGRLGHLGFRDLLP
jgi:hypothetical protein